MFALVVRFDLHPGTSAAFDDLVDESLTLIRVRKPGTLIYARHQVEGSPESRILCELYETRSAFEEHEADEHVKPFLQTREQFLAGPPRVEFLHLPARFQPAVLAKAGPSQG
jgi:quinol monooxygenase YgiN